MKKKLAIIGASTGQLPLCNKANEMGLETHCFAYEKGAVCKDVAYQFHPISIFEMDSIVDACRKIGINGVVSNASEATALVANYVAEKLDLPCTPYATLQNIQHKDYVRNATKGIDGLSQVKYLTGRASEVIDALERPYILKPTQGSAKQGVMMVDKGTVIPDDVRNSDATYLVEQFISGQEYSVETLSANGKHQVIQITEKDNSGAPHFVELAHHEPAMLSDEQRQKVADTVGAILSAVGYQNGAAHVEIKIDATGAIYLIEVNPRGGGDFISNTLVSLSTDFDYLRGMIEVALGEYTPRPVHNVAYAGIYFLSGLTPHLEPWFDKKEPWMHEVWRDNGPLLNAQTNYDHNGYIIYLNDKKIQL